MAASVSAIGPHLLIWRLYITMVIKTLLAKFVGYFGSMVLFEGVNSLFM